MTRRFFTHAVDACGKPFSLLAVDGRIAALGSDLAAPADAERIDLDGELVLPGFVDGHVHLDKSFVGDRWHPHVPAADLRARLQAEKALLAAAKPVAERADALLRLAASYGTVALRSHVDVDATTGLDNLHAVMQVRDAWRDLVQVELVAFPQAGVISCPGTAEMLEEAARAGVDVIGGIDPSVLDGDAEGQLDVVFGLAERYGKKIDIHLHEPGLQGVRQLARIAARTQATGLGGRVTVSHAYALGDVDSDELARVAQALAAADVAIMTNAPGDGSFPPVKPLRAAGVRVMAGSDNIQDAWWPFGNGDMLERAMLIAYRSAFYTDADLRLALAMATQVPAQVLGLAHYGLAVGNPADFVVLGAANAAAAVATSPRQRRVVRHGAFWAPDTVAHA